MSFYEFCAGATPSSRGRSEDRIRYAANVYTFINCLTPFWSCSDEAMTKRTKMARLRAQGLTLQEIGERLGVSRQRVHALLKEEAVPRPGITCRRCGSEIAPWPGASRNLGPVYCVACLPANASFGLRLRAYRVAAKLTQAELASRIGVPPGMICYWERDQRRPMRRNLAALAAILGAELKRGSGWGERGG